MRKALVGSLALIMIGCGSTPPPKELLDARAAYQKAAAGPAKEVNPAQLHVAKESLEEAEKSFNDDPSSQETKDRAYIAGLKAQMADSEAGRMVAEQDRNKAMDDYRQLSGKELRSTREQLKSAQQEAATEKKGREEAEKRAKEALENLARMATVKQETRGMVITLSGAVLFASGASELLPAAQASLDNVVTALKANPDRNVVIEGHTDSQGARQFNMDLSQRRAESVRSFLVSRGIAPEIIRAVGIGPDRPVADNKTAEGRANNRRVEIIVSPAEHK